MVGRHVHAGARRVVRSLAGRLARDRRGSVAVLSVFLLAIVIGAAAVAVDYGSMVLRKRQLQGMTDRAAMTAVLQGGDPRVAAQNAIAADGVASVTLIAAQSGSYNPDPAVAVAARFQPAAGGVAAVQVQASQRVPLFFARVFTGRRYVDLRAVATAARTGEAAISVGSRLVSVQGGVPGMLLSQLAGVDLNLSIADYNALVGANVDLFALSGLLKTRAGVTLGSFDSTAAAVVDLPTLVTAMADAATPGSGASLLRSIAVKLPPTKVDLGRIVNLGSGTILKSLNVGADELLREVLIGTGGDRQLTLDLGGQVPGVGSTKASVIIGSRAATSPWVRVGRDASVTVSTSQIRIAITARVDVAGLGLVTTNLPVILEGAGGEARLASVACGSDGATVGAALTRDPRRGEACGEPPRPSASTGGSRRCERSSARYRTPRCATSTWRSSRSRRRCCRCRPPRSPDSPTCRSAAATGRARPFRPPTSPTTRSRRSTPPMRSAG